MRLLKFVLILLVIMVVGLNMAGQGVKKVVGSGDWEVLGCRFQEEEVALTFLNKAYTIDYTPVLETAALSKEIMEKVKVQGEDLWKSLLSLLGI
ncbi:hypothetical protein RDV78_02810 [Bacillota bacterium LX-D]|nr:hypothetical protein [Bacillota bacterium LX-D]